MVAYENLLAQFDGVQKIQWKIEEKVLVQIPNVFLCSKQMNNDLIRASHECYA